MDDIAAPKLSHDQRLDRLAEIAVQVGLRLVPEQELVSSAPIDALPLVRRITEHAYKASASLVTTLFGDDASTLLRFKHAADESFTGRPGGCPAHGAMGRHSVSMTFRPFSPSLVKRRSGLPLMA